ncbi:hypothetical protein B0H14DRAFT_2399395, partial [Mycena olivaceomarginata]
TTRARDLMNRNDEKIRMQAEKYVAAWEAKRALVGEEKVEWHRLDPKKDLQCMDGEEDQQDVSEGVGEGQRRKDPTGEGRRTISWIWMGIDTSSDTTSEAVLKGAHNWLRVEWCKAWARTRRWTEEILLLREEMCCVPISLRHKAEWRRAHRTPTGFKGAHAEGAAAYAMRQAELYSDLAEQFKTLWTPVRDLEVVEGEEIVQAGAADLPPDSEDEDELAGPEEGAEAGTESAAAGDDDMDDGVDEEEAEQNEEEEEGSVGELDD